jgi:hypothetical protein
MSMTGRFAVVLFPDALRACHQHEAVRRTSG